jgi:glutathione synthase
LADGRGEIEISVVYFRAGYTPDDYKSDEDWKTRRLMEESQAIKCPTVGYQLAGMKKIQQVLCEPGVLERYLKPLECSMVRKCFAGVVCTIKSLLFDCDDTT